MFNIAISLLAEKRPMSSESILDLPDDELERLWSACQMIFKTRLVRYETQVDIGCLAADLSLERSRRLQERAAARKAVAR